MSVPLAVALWVAVALAAGSLVRWRARRYYLDPASDPDTAAHLRRLRRAGLLAGWLLTAVATAALGVPAVAVDALSSVLPVAVAAVVGPVAVFLLPVVPVALAVRLATVPYRAAVRGLQVRYRDAAAWELERDGVGALAVLAGTIVIALAPAGLERALTAVAIGFVATALAPFAVVVALRTRWPTADERARLADVLGGVRLRVVDDRTRVGSAFAAGVLPGARYVFVTESLFDVLDDDELRAVVAHEVGHHERHHVLLRFSTLALAASAALGLSALVPDEAALVTVAVGAAPVAVVLAWVVRATERSADDYAAAAVGGAALASALERLAERRYVFDATGLARAFAAHPPLAERIAGLRDGAVRER